MAEERSIARDCMNAKAHSPNGVGTAAGQQEVKILLVDDTPENLVSLEAALDTLGEELVLARLRQRSLRDACWKTISRRSCWT